MAVVVVVVNKTVFNPMCPKKQKQKKQKTKSTRKLTNQSVLVKMKESSPSAGCVTVTLFTRLEMQVTSE